MQEREFGARLSPAFLTYKCSCLAYLVILVFTYGTLMVLQPSFSIDNFYVPALNLNSTVDTRLIFFNLKLGNEMNVAGLRYEAVNLTFSYVANTSNNSNDMVLATYNVPGFYQGMNKKAGRRRRRRWGFFPATHAKHNNGIFFFLHRRINIKAEGTVKVDDSGNKESNDSVELKSDNDPSIVRVIFWIFGLLILILISALGYIID